MHVKYQASYPHPGKQPHFFLIASPQSIHFVRYSKLIHLSTRRGSDEVSCAFKIDAKRCSARLANSMSPSFTPFSLFLHLFCFFNFAFSLLLIFINHNSDNQLSRQKHWTVLLRRGVVVNPAGHPPTFILYTICKSSSPVCSHLKRKQRTREKQEEESSD